MEQECQTEIAAVEGSPSQHTDAASETEKEMDATEKTPPVAMHEHATKSTAERDDAQDGSVSKIDSESVLGLFKAFAVVSHSYLFMRLCMCLEHDKQQITANDLKELAHLAQLILEMPIPDTSILLRQERPGSDHLALFLSDSTLHPMVSLGLVVCGCANVGVAGLVVHGDQVFR